MRTRRAISLALALGLMLGAPAVVQGKPRAASKTQSKTPAWGGEDSPLRPGASFVGSVGSCTYNFVFYRPGTKKKPPVGYIGTAGHCTDKLGEVVTNPDVGDVGTVVYDSDLVDSGVDFTLIQLYPEVVPQTNPSVLHWGGPTRSVTQEDLAVGDQVNVYGYGIVVGEAEQTRPRSGVLVSFTEEEYQANMPAVNGDSGGPLIHAETGAALGIISRYGFTVPPSTDLGPLMPWILEELDEAGFKLKLATVAQ